MRGLVWFKKDLRLYDNPALFHATTECADGVLAVYVIDFEMWKKNAVSERQIQFIFEGLQTLRVDLQKINVALIVTEVKKSIDIPKTLLPLCEKAKLQKIFFNKEYEVNESRRDEAVTAYFSKHRILTVSFEDQLILPYSAVKTKQHDYFKVFTPFKREWLRVYSESAIRLWAKPKKVKPLSVSLEDVPLAYSRSDKKGTLWPAGEMTANKRLKQFLEKNIFSYKEKRDYPFDDATSHLSPYLAVGMISARTCFMRAYETNQFELDSGQSGILTWQSELIWRDFYRHVLIAVPRVCMNKAFQLKTENLPWRYDEKQLTAWQQGLTGFPIVDAAMRQLNTIGWMHNRLRMVIAMFLSKILFLNWREGEKYFAENLIDYDFASNNGGWQWSASTGTDAVPYFRIFNPTLQSKRFDPEGNFIRQYCPELKNLPSRFIHEPGLLPKAQFDLLHYPSPIINYKNARQQTIQLFRSLR